MLFEIMNLMDSIRPNNSHKKFAFFTTIVDFLSCRTSFHARALLLLHFFHVNLIVLEMEIAGEIRC